MVNQTELSHYSDDNIILHDILFRCGMDNECSSFVLTKELCYHIHRNTSDTVTFQVTAADKLFLKGNI